jgi:acyl-coenzyme A thioesterase PaaI-like protein
MKHFETKKQENKKSILKRWAFNLFPAIRRTGGRVSFISDDNKEIHIRLPLNWKTRNYVGTVFGGSIYACTDPFYMIQFMHILGNEYVVWDKSANIKFKRPIKQTVYARFLVTDDMLLEVNQKVSEAGFFNIDIPVNLVDKKGVIYAEVLKTIYIASKEYYKAKRKK